VKSRQVGYVLMALIALGVIGIVLRLISAGGNELVLEGILPISPDVIDRVTITSPTSQAKLDRVPGPSGVWEIDGNLAFVPKLDALWTATEDIDGAQLVAENPANHERMGVGDDQGTYVVFWFGGSIQEEFIIGDWSPDVRLCYLRKPARDQVYGIPCPLANIFDPNADGWRDPIVVSIPRDVIDMVEFSYPDEEFALRRVARGWTIDSGSGEEAANIFAVNAVLSNIEVLVSREFAGQEEVQGLDFAGRDSASVRITPNSESGFPVTRVRFLPRDNTSFYARTPVQSTVFIVDAGVTANLLLTATDFSTSN